MDIPGQKKYTQIDPLEISESLGFQTFRRGGRKPWTKGEDTKLITLMNEMYPNRLHDLDPDNIRWDIIAQKISPSGMRKSKDCRKRWINSLDPRLKKGKWTQEEDERLIQAFNKYGSSWHKVSQEIDGRTDDQCAKRYIEVLDPKTKDRLKTWDRQEDLKLINLVKTHGTKWRTISMGFSGRPSLTCRNRWRKILTDVVRGKADTLVKEEVEKSTGENLSLNDGTKRTVSDFLDQKDMSRNLNIDNRLASAGVLLSQQNTNEALGLDQEHQKNKNGNRSTKYLKPTESEFNNIGNEGNSFPRKRKYPSDSHSDLRWSFSLSDREAAQELPPNKLFSHGNDGSIKDEETARYLVSYASQNGIEIAIHQHIHHHYSVPSPMERIDPKQNYSLSSKSTRKSSPFYKIDGPLEDTVEQLGNESAFEKDDRLIAAQTSFESFPFDPEAKLGRFRHFNYLPPLTEVPKLYSSTANSSKVGNGNVSQTGEGSSSMYEDKNTTNQPREDNQNSLPNKFGVPDFHMEKDKQSPSDMMTPLTQAVEMAVAAETGDERGEELRRSQNSDRSYSFKRRTSNLDIFQSSNDQYQGNPSENNTVEDEEMEEGMDFWETMRNLTELPNQQFNMFSNGTDKLLRKNQPLNQKPVSQHHPLHYFSGSITPHPSKHYKSPLDKGPYGDVDSEEEPEESEEPYLIDSSGKDSYALPNSFHDGASLHETTLATYDMIPFNPS